jgi:flagellar biosynthesis chaperone FliJ
MSAAQPILDVEPSPKCIVALVKAETAVKDASIDHKDALAKLARVKSRLDAISDRITELLARREHGEKRADDAHLHGLLIADSQRLTELLEPANEAVRLAQSALAVATSKHDEAIQKLVRLIAQGILPS